MLIENPIEYNYIFWNLLPELSHKSFMFTAILRVTRYETAGING